MDLIKTYYNLAKPGMVYGNATSAIAGFLLASKGVINFELFLGMLTGICLVMAGGCVFNNYIDRGLDAKMARTQKRALVQKLISLQNAIIYATILSLLGISILMLTTNLLTTAIALLGLFFYVVMYGIWKRKSVHGTLIGSISGSIPPVIGYCAVTNNFDTGALLLFLILTFWQMPHFYAIAIYRLDDYASAGLPVLPVKSGIKNTKTQMLFYISAFILAVVALKAFNYAGYIYLLVMLIISLVWLKKAIDGFKTSKNEIWAKGMFRFSLIVLLTFCAMISLTAWLP